MPHFRLPAGLPFGATRSTLIKAASLCIALSAAVAPLALPALAQSPRPRPNDAYRPPEGSGGSLGTLDSSGGSTGYGTGAPSAPPVGQAPAAGPGGYNQPTSGYGDPLPNTNGPARGDGYRPPDGYQSGGYQNDSGRYASPAPSYGQGPGYGQPYNEPPPDSDRRGAPATRSGQYADDPDGPSDRNYSKGEIVNAGGRFFGSITKGLASVIEYTYQKAGRPNGYILGEDAGGAFIGGLRYGEGTLYTKDAGTHKVYWQGPSVGYDVGGEGSKTMVLVYNLRDPSELYERFGGIEGSAYLVGGVSVQFQKRDDIILAPIRSGIGLRLGANIGYLKYTRKPTWNPF